jgi:hypothetical protein
MKVNGCQLGSLETIARGSLKYPPLSVTRRVKLEIRKKLSPEAFRSLKKNLDVILSKFELRSRNDRLQVSQADKVSYKSGDRVRVRSQEEIEALINRWKETKGCGFMDGMWEYCDTTQVVKKLILRFVDERTLEIKKTRGIVILENVYCNGTLIFGECDRSCYFFWREEWLEKID